ALQALGIFDSGKTLVLQGAGSGKSDTAIIDGYDFSLHGGINVGGDTSGPAPPTIITITNCKFKLGTNTGTSTALFSAGQNPIDITLKFNEFDGNGRGTTTEGLINWGSWGHHVIQYNLIQNAWAENFVFASVNTNGIFIDMRFNVIRNTGIG